MNYDRQGQFHESKDEVEEAPKEKSPFAQHARLLHALACAHSRHAPHTRSIAAGHHYLSSPAPTMAAEQQRSVHQSEQALASAAKEGAEQLHNLREHGMFDVKRAVTCSASPLGDGPTESAGETKVLHLIRHGQGFHSTLHSFALAHCLIDLFRCCLLAGSTRQRQRRCL